jgi:hypothetical protein
MLFLQIKVDIPWTTGKNLHWGYFSNSTSGGHFYPSRNLLQFKSKTQEANVVERELVKSSAPHALLPLTKKQLQLDQNPKIPCVYP